MLLITVFKINMRFSFMIFKLVLMRVDKNRKFPKLVVLDYGCLMNINVYLS